MRLLPLWVLLFLFCAPAVMAQWSELRAKNPQGIQLTLQLAEPHSYRAGELIRARVLFTGPNFAPAQRAQGFWQFAGLLLDPHGNCGTLSSPCYQPASMAMMFDKTDPMFGLGHTSEPLAVSLNNYIPAPRPGRYRAAVLVRKFVPAKRGPMRTTYGDPDPPQYAVSNAVEIEVVPATGAWVKQAIAASAAVLNGPQANTREEYERRRTAAEQLRFLDVPAAWRASLAILPVEANILLRGLEATGEPRRVCELMQAAVPAPSQVVSSYYLYGMARTCARANLPAPPPSAKPRPGEKPPEPTAEQLEYWRKHREYEQDVMGKASASLASSVARKQGEAKTMAFQTLMEGVRQIRANQPPQPLPAWIPAVLQEFTRSYAQIERWRQANLLGLYAGTLRTRDLIPLLESVMDGWKPGDQYEASREALRNLHTIDSARAQARIVAELGKDRTWLHAPELELLPASVARISDDALIQALAAAQRPGGWNAQLSMTALAKYASPKVLPRIKAIYESQQDQCQPELMAYFVRVDPPYADRVFRNHPWDMHTAPPLCTVRYFQRTPQIAMGPVLERYMSAYLMHGHVVVKKTAAESLGRFGSPAAVGPLWDAFRYFHNYWKGKQEELVQNGEGVYLEVELRNAIARAKNWLATETDLRTIESLCVSERCLYETQQDLRAWQSPLRIEIGGQSGGIRAAVAQYYGIESMEGLEQKLGQFPKGTQFALTTYGEVPEGAADRIRRYAAAHGLTVAGR